MGIKRSKIRKRKVIAFFFKQIDTHTRILKCN